MKGELEDEKGHQQVSLRSQVHSTSRVGPGVQGRMAGRWGGVTIAFEMPSAKGLVMMG